MMVREVHFENIVRSPEEDGLGLFEDVHHDIGLSEAAAYAALLELKASWEGCGTSLEQADIEFVSSTIKETIETLQRWHKAWVATVEADMWIEMAAEYARLGDFERAGSLHAKAREARRTFKTPSIRKTLEIVCSPYSKIEELMDAAEESA